MIENIPFKLTDKYVEVCNNYSTIYEIYKDVDDYGFLSQSTALELEELLKEKDDYYIGIHRTGIQSAESIIESGGLRLTGHLSSGSPNKPLKSIDDIGLNISFYDSLFMLVRELKVSCKYKTFHNNGDAIIYKIPKNIDINNLVTYDPVYGYILNNSCVYGYVHVNDGVVSQIYHNKTKVK